jgi:hypothetical protein
MPATLEDEEWEILMNRIREGKCTPFLGAGTCFGTLPLGGVIAKKWAKKHGYPLDDSFDLARVSQFLAVKFDAVYPKERILQEFFVGVNPPDFRKPDEPHGILAELPLPVYMTTNYDDFMVQALRGNKKDVQTEICRWNKTIKYQPSVFRKGFRPTATNPVVFHLHGHLDLVNSLVLTEDDYLDFLVNISRDQDLVPPRIQEALTSSSLLFIGYSLADWDFRVLFRGLVMAMEQSQRRISITVQLPPGSNKSSQKQVQKYLDDYFGKYEMKVYWGTANKFAKELRSRWQKFSNSG